MKPIEGYDKINEAGEIVRLPAGIYGVKITKVVDNPQNEYLEVYCDITKGDYANYFKQLTDLGLKDTSLSFRSYKTKAIPFFKAFITAIEKTNPGFNWDWDEQKLVGKNVMAVFGEEEYKDNDGNVKVATRVVEFRSYEAYKEGKLKVPPLKKLPPEPEQETPSDNAPSLVDIPDEELPF